MASNTPNLQLYKADPVIDGDDLFDINKLLNGNWDKIDQKTKSILQSISSLSSSLSNVSTVANGRAQAAILSYMGTGVYGQSSPNSITAPFPIKVAFFLGYYANGSWTPDTNGHSIAISELGSTSYTRRFGFCQAGHESTLFGKIYNGNKTIEFYSENSAGSLNNKNGKYFFLCIG